PAEIGAERLGFCDVRRVEGRQETQRDDDQKEQQGCHGSPVVSELTQGRGPRATASVHCRIPDFGGDFARRCCLIRHAGSTLDVVRCWHLIGCLLIGCGTAATTEDRRCTTLRRDRHCTQDCVTIQ